MTGAQYFVVYTSKDGKNVTVSPRLADGHHMPEFSQDANITLLEGSGVHNGTMTANVKCRLPLSTWQTPTASNKGKVQIATPGMAAIWTSRPVARIGSGRTLQEAH
jgi:hypothetical protein